MAGMELEPLSTLVVAAAVGGAYFDLREHRLPNSMTVGIFLIALLLRVLQGWSMFFSGVLGAVICFVVALPFFLVGGAGGGDIKYLTAVGALLGPANLPRALFVMAMTGGVLAVVAIGRRGSVTEVAANLKTILSTLSRRTFTGWKGEQSEAALHLESENAVTVPYGVAIAAGALAGWFL